VKTLLLLSEQQRAMRCDWRRSQAVTSLYPDACNASPYTHVCYTGSTLLHAAVRAMASSAATPIAVADTVYTKTDGTVSASKFDRTGTMYKVRIVIDSTSSLAAFLPRLEFVLTLRLMDMRMMGIHTCTVQLSLHLGQWQERIFSLSIKKKTLYYFRSQAEYKQFIDFGIPRSGAV